MTYAADISFDFYAADIGFVDSTYWMRFEDGAIMLFEDGAVMIYEEG